MIVGILEWFNRLTSTQFTYLIAIFEGIIAFSLYLLFISGILKIDICSLILSYGFIFLFGISIYSLYVERFRWK
jgi:hypothetical protein